ncbi:hypothetical protein FGSG_00687 [Fusarium graminearum PH-1]|uniref:hypothetical protein n=1 Tax=Gibberella zeae (strain ATCC MYA-4620 / CBS 123657 / FGSC 9075 / NRRL 31084 / PH-1) TaxID=229533 RepID=UPI000023F328|nr:hypothetical protein FGSG_00687 [Fusarium graminearum PH-1]ESU05901.1 hypothetical protein FGSG_00687 [Fusarium graminearum PH-1]|eukprot:XP_011316386.1 hypothetical protein FGSG_00687 [Fusarium graminearum PH-1]
MRRQDFRDTPHHGLTKKDLWTFYDPRSQGKGKASIPSIKELRRKGNAAERLIHAPVSIHLMSHSISSGMLKCRAPATSSIRTTHTTKQQNSSSVLKSMD